jgi:plasmid stabilization system protein ParE
LGYHVEIAEPALIDAEEYVRFIQEVKQEPDAAEEWFRGLVRAIYSLEDAPLRCPAIPEEGEFRFEIRHLMYFSHRIIFRVERRKKTVTVLRVYHGSRKRLTGSLV